MSVVLHIPLNPDMGTLQNMNSKLY